MPGIKETTRDQGRQTEADLRRQYRPIGIGAVAAALSAAGKPVEEAAANGNERQHERESAANSNERQHDHESLAA